MQSFRPSENLFYPPGQLETNGEGAGEGEGERTSGTVPKEENHRISLVVRARRPSLAVPTEAQKQRERRASRTSVCLAQALGQEVVQQVSQVALLRSSKSQGVSGSGVLGEFGGRRWLSCQ